MIVCLHFLLWFYLCVYVCACHSVNVEVRGNHVKVHSLLKPHGSELRLSDLEANAFTS